MVFQFQKIFNKQSQLNQKAIAIFAMAFFIKEICINLLFTNYISDEIYIADIYNITL